VAAAARARAARLQKLAGATKVPYWAEQISIQAAVVEALATRAEGRTTEALAMLRKAAEREDATEKHVVTPGPIVPARELLAYATLEAGEPATALREFESVLQREPNRNRAFAGAARAAERSGDARKAAEYAKRLADLAM